MESMGLEGNVRPVSSVVENDEVKPPSSMHSLEENDAMLKASVSSCEKPTLKQEEFHPKHEISSHLKLTKNLTSAEDGDSQGVDVDIENAGSLPQSKTFGGCSEPSCFVVDADGGQNSRNQITQLESREDVKQKTSRSGQCSSICLLHLLLMRPI